MDGLVAAILRGIPQISIQCLEFSRLPMSACRVTAGILLSSRECDRRSRNNKGKVEKTQQKIISEGGVMVRLRLRLYAVFGLASPEWSPLAGDLERGVSQNSAPLLTGPDLESIFKK